MGPSVGGGGGGGRTSKGSCEAAFKRKLRRGETSENDKLKPFPLH